MHLRQINRCLRYPLFIAVASFLFSIPIPKLYALNINGLVELDYHSTTTSIKNVGDKSESSTSDLIQRYVINGAGVIVDPRLASYSASIGLTDSVYRSKPAAGESIKVNRDTLTYSLQMNLIPAFSPINLFAQKNIIAVENAPDLISDTYSIGWTKTIRTVTSLRATLLQLGTEYEDPVSPRNTRIRIANLGLTQRLTAGSLSANYQYTDYLVTSKGEETSSKVHSYSMRGENRLTPSLLLNGNITYFPKGSVFTPGITSTAETTGEVGLLHQIEKFNESVNYAFRKTQSGEITRDVLSYNMTYRPLGKTDYRADALYSSTNSSQSDTSEYRVSGGLNHRPFYGLSITGNLILDHLDVSGITETRVDRIGTMAGINYYKLLDAFNLNTNYTTDYSKVLSTQDEAEGSVFTQTASLGLQTRTLETAQVLGSYSLLIRQNDIVPTDDRQEQTVHLEAFSSYFRQWLLRASTNFSNILDYGDTFILDTRADYFPAAGTTLAGGYRFSNLPSASNSQDSQLYFVEGSYSRYLTRRINLNLMAHGEREDLRYTEKNRATLTSTFNYQLGRINLNLELREDYTKYPQSVYNIQSYFIRASRPF